MWRISIAPWLVTTTFLVGCPNGQRVIDTDRQGPPPPMPVYYLYPVDVTTSTADVPPELHVSQLPHDLTDTERATVEGSLRLVEYPSQTVVATVPRYLGGVESGLSGQARFTLTPVLPLARPWYAIQFTPPPGMFRGDQMTNGRPIPGGHESRFSPRPQPVFRSVGICVKAGVHVAVSLNLSELGKASTAAPGDLLHISVAERALTCVDATSINGGAFSMVEVHCPWMDAASFRVTYAGGITGAANGTAFLTMSGAGAIDVSLSSELAPDAPCTSVEPN